MFLVNYQHVFVGDEAYPQGHGKGNLSEAGPVSTADGRHALMGYRAPAGGKEFRADRFTGNGLDHDMAYGFRAFRPQSFTDGIFPVVKEAGTQMPVRSEAQPIAGTAETLRH